MRRFFLPAHARTGDLITLTDTEARHIATVLRLTPGHTVEFFDGEGQVVTAILQLVDRRRVTATVTAIRREQSRAHAPLTLAQCLLKGKKMDLLVQKATELGVQVFLPLASTHCENHGERGHQLERWQRIMIEACKQCHRVTPMTILPVVPLDQADFTPYAHRLAAWEGERLTALPTGFVAQPGPICLLLGPEGGLHADDLAMLHRSLFTTFSLGRNILRGETAALAAMAIVQYLSGVLQPDAGNVTESSAFPPPPPQVDLS
jgi:16S rRNA (uracil1498-N3)-methyltransferase